MSEASPVNQRQGSAGTRHSNVSGHPQGSRSISKVFSVRLQFIGIWNRILPINQVYGFCNVKVRLEQVILNEVNKHICLF